MMEKQPTELKEQLRFIGNLVEEKIKTGEVVFLGEPERVWKRELLKKTGIDFTNIEGKANLSEQAKTVFEKFGEERIVELMKKVVLELNKVPGGSIFGEGVKPLVEDSEIQDFIESYVKRLPKIGFGFVPNKYCGDGKTPGGDWKKETIVRMEAIFSVVNKLMWIMAAEDQQEGVRRQGTNGIGKHLRERTVLGCEAAGDIINADMPRFMTDDLRFLPKGGLGVIFENL